MIFGVFVAVSLVFIKFFCLIKIPTAKSQNKRKKQKCKAASLLA